MANTNATFEAAVAAMQRLAHVAHEKEDAAKVAVTERLSATVATGEQALAELRGLKETHGDAVAALLAWCDRSELDGYPALAQTRERLQGNLRQITRLFGSGIDQIETALALAGRLTGQHDDVDEQFVRLEIRNGAGFPHDVRELLADSERHAARLVDLEGRVQYQAPPKPVVHPRLPDPRPSSHTVGAAVEAVL